MTITKVSPLLFAFGTNIEMAMNTVLKMTSEDKLKAVQFWNLMSEKLQDIVNNSTAEISIEKQEINMDMIDALHSKTVHEDTPTNSASCIESDAKPPDGKNDQSLGNVNIFSKFIGHSSGCESENVGAVTELSSDPDGQETVNASNGACLTETADCVENAPPHEPLNANTGEAACHKSQNDEGTTENVPKSEATAFSVPEHEKGIEKKKSSKSKSFYNYVMKRTNSRLRKQKKKAAVSTDTKETSLNIYDAPLCESSSDLKIEGGHLQLRDIHLEENPTDTTKELHDDTKQRNVKARPCPCELCKAKPKPADNTKLLKNFPCAECPKVFKCLANLTVHIRKHTGERPYSCEQCGATFTTRGNLKRHASTHSGERPWKCEECGKLFTEKKSLNVHVRSHTGERPFECKECGKRFSQSGVLISHMAVHTDVKDHFCDVCGKSFKVKTQLRVHRLRHETPRKFVCDSCPSQFLTNADLKRHRRSHTGEKPFACDVCKKRFTRLHSLKEHMNRHEGVKPHACGICEKTFADRNGLTKHLRRHAKMKRNLLRSKLNSKSDIEDTLPEYRVEDAVQLSDMPRFFTVVLNPKDCISGNQTLLLNPVNASSAVSDGFRLLTAIDLANVPSTPT